MRRLSIPRSVPKSTSPEVPLRRGRDGLSPETRTLIIAANEVLQWPEQAGVLIVGSRAEAIAEDSSNANLLLLGCPRQWVAGLEAKGAIIRPMTLLDNAIVYVGQTEMSLDIVSEPARDRLADVMASVVVLDDPTNSNLELPALDLFELRLMARLESGVILQSEAVVQSWRHALRVERFRSYYVVCTYLVAQHYLNKSLASAADGDQLGAMLRSNTAAEHLAYSALALYGHLLHESKNLGRHVATVLKEDPDAPVALRKLGDLLATGPDRLDTRSQCLHSWSKQLLTAIAADPSLVDAHSFLTATE